MNVVDEIFDLFARRGGEAYFGEPVSQLEHALQTAWQAEQGQCSRQSNRPRLCCTTSAICCTNCRKTSLIKALTPGMNRSAAVGWPNTFRLQ